MDKSYKGNMISMKLSDDIDGLTITLSKFNKLLAQNIKKHFVDKKDSFSKKMIQEMKERGETIPDTLEWIDALLLNAIMEKEALEARIEDPDAQLNFDTMSQSFWANK